jgi:Na+/melibiose symporter-like transporter
MILVSVVSLAIFALPPGSETAFKWLFAAKGLCFGAFAYLPIAMMADVIDIDTARSRDPRTGSYFAVHGFMTKCAASFAGLSLPLLALTGYDATPGAGNGADALLWLSVLYAIVPTVLFLLALYLCWTWPLTAERHQRFRERIARRDARAARAAETAQPL